jgi:hypothetical protein
VVNIEGLIFFRNLFSNYSLAAKLRLSIVTTASAAVIYHKCSLYLEKTDFDQYVSSTIISSNNFASYFLDVSSNGFIISE